MSKSGCTKGFTFFEVIMALLVAALALTSLITTQGSLFKRSSQFLHSYQAIIALKDAWYEKRWQCLLNGPQSVLKTIKEKETVNDLSISIIKGTIPEPFVIGKDKGIFETTFLQLNVTSTALGKSYNFKVPLVIAEKIPQKKEKEQKAKT